MATLSLRKSTGPSALCGPPGEVIGWDLERETILWTHETVRIAGFIGSSLYAALDSAAELAPYVDRFFDEVLVMDEDDAVRANRLRLLLDVRDALGRLGDFSQIPR